MLKEWEKTKALLIMSWLFYNWKSFVSTLNKLTKFSF